MDSLPAASPPTYSPAVGAPQDLVIDTSVDQQSTDEQVEEQSDADQHAEDQFGDMDTLPASPPPAYLAVQKPADQDVEAQPIIEAHQNQNNQGGLVFITDKLVAWMLLICCLTGLSVWVTFLYGMDQQEKLCKARNKAFITWVNGFLPYVMTFTGPALMALFVGFYSYTLRGVSVTLRSHFNTGWRRLFLILTTLLLALLTAFWASLVDPRLIKCEHYL